MHKPLDEFFGRHMKIVFQFSSGKDSAACLELLKDYWHRMVVVWVNPGDAYPETIAYMEKVKETVPHFLEIRGSCQEWIAEHGYPVDILPVMKLFRAEVPEILFQPFYSCCSANMWQPMVNWCLAHEVTGIIRGQKVCDSIQGPAQHGQIRDGFEYFYPLNDWSDEQVLEFLGDRIPESYKRGLITSLDCMGCTAYVEKNPGRIKDLENIDPVKAAEIRRVHRELQREVLATFDLMENTEDGN